MPVDKPAPPDSAIGRVKRRDPQALSPGLARTRAGWVSRLGQIFSARKQIDPALVEELEKVLLTADIGVRTSQKLLADVRSSLDTKELAEPSAVWALPAAALPGDAQRRRRAGRLRRAQPLRPAGHRGQRQREDHHHRQAGGQATAAGARTCCSPPGDTFRAAATEQLEVWGKRVGVAVVRGKEGADPSSVIFDAVKRAKAEGIDVVIADTAGRLHTKADLMQELQKVARGVLSKARTGAPHETWLVIDATTRAERHRPGADLHRGHGRHAASCSPSSTAPPRAA